MWHMSAMVGIGGNGWQYPKIPSQPASDLLPKLTCAYVPNSHLSSKDRRTLYATTITISIDEKLSCCQQSSTDPSGSFPRPLLGLKAFHCPTADRLIPKIYCCQQRRESEATAGNIPKSQASQPPISYQSWHVLISLLLIYPAKIGVRCTLQQTISHRWEIILLSAVVYRPLGVIPTPLVGA